MPGASSSAALNRLLASLGLPADRLSAAIVSFAQFFSLPLEPRLLAQVRRQALSAGTPQSAQALSLAALAGAGKGVELSRAGLESYAAALSPVEPAGEKKSRERNSGGKDSAGRAPQKGQDLFIDAAAIAAGPRALGEKVLEAAGNPLLEVLNRLPGKNGRRWLVLPFNFSEQGGQYRVSLKILLDEDSSRQDAPAAGRMALEIVGYGAAGGAGRRWLFVLDNQNGKNRRLTVYLQPPWVRRKQQSLIQELSRCLEIRADCIFLRNFTESFPFETENADTVLLPFDEEV